MNLPALRKQPEARRAVGHGRPRSIAGRAREHRSLGEAPCRVRRHTLPRSTTPFAALLDALNPAPWRRWLFLLRVPGEGMMRLPPPLSRARSFSRNVLRWRGVPGFRCRRVLRLRRQRLLFSPARSTAGSCAWSQRPKTSPAFSGFSPTSGSTRPPDASPARPPPTARQPSTSPGDRLAVRSFRDAGTLTRCALTAERAACYWPGPCSREPQGPAIPTPPARR